MRAFNGADMHNAADMRGWKSCGYCCHTLMPNKHVHGLQDGYDHSYAFISTFVDDHLRHHAEALKA